MLLEECLVCELPHHATPIYKKLEPVELSASDGTGIMKVSLLLLVDSIEEMCKTLGLDKWYAEELMYLIGQHYLCCK